MNPFQFYLALGGLKEAGFIREARHMEGALLFLTPQGRESVEMFASRIRASQQEKLDTHAAEWKRRIRDELQMPPSGKRRITVFPSHCARWKAARKSFP